MPLRRKDKAIKVVKKYKKGGDLSAELPKEEGKVMKNLKKYGIPIFLGIAAFNLVDSILANNPRLFK